MFFPDGNAVPDQIILKQFFDFTPVKGMPLHQVTNLRFTSPVFKSAWPPFPGAHHRPQLQYDFSSSNSIWDDPRVSEHSWGFFFSPE